MRIVRFSEDTNRSIQEATDRVECELLEIAVAENRASREVLLRLCELYPCVGKQREALVLAERLVRLDPSDAALQYQLACNLALADEIDMAVGCLRQAAALGYCDLDQLLSNSDLLPLHDHPSFPDIVSLMRRHKTTRGPRFA